MNYSEKDRFDRLTDAEIWDLFISGNESAFDHIYQMSFDRLFNYGRQFTPDQSLVEDAIQELFIDLRRRASFLSPTDKIMPYLYNAFRRKVIRLRDRSRRHQEFDAARNHAFTFSIEDQIIDGELVDEDMKKLRKAVEDLPEKYREIIYYFYYESLSYQEIQDILGFDNIKSVRNLLYKAVKALRKLLLMVVLMFSFCFKLFRNYQISINC